LEQLVPQLQEQLQVNFVQQTHLLQTDRSKTSPALQQLQIQQQQLISQLQLVQQRLIMVSKITAVNSAAAADSTAAAAVEEPIYG
jgi:hypothetical protein